MKSKYYLAGFLSIYFVLSGFIVALAVRAIGLMALVLLIALSLAAPRVYRFFAEHPEPVHEDVFKETDLADFAHGLATGSFSIVFSFFLLLAVLFVLQKYGLYTLPF